MIHVLGEPRSSVGTVIFGHTLILGYNDMGFQKEMAEAK